MSRDAVAVASLLGTFITLWLLTSAFAQQLGGFMALCLTTMGEEPREVGSTSGELAIQAIMVILKTVGPVIAVAILCAVGATFAQTRFLVSGEFHQAEIQPPQPFAGH